MFNCYLSNYLLNDSKYKDLANNKLFDGLAIPNSYIVTNVACNQCKESEEYEEYKHYQQLEKLGTLNLNITRVKRVETKINFMKIDLDNL